MDWSSRAIFESRGVAYVLLLPPRIDIPMIVQRSFATSERSLFSVDCLAAQVLDRVRIFSLMKVRCVRNVLEPR
jgi:hypothetical protein